MAPDPVGSGRLELICTNEPYRNHWRSGGQGQPAYASAPPVQAAVTGAGPFRIDAYSGAFVEDLNELIERGH